MKLAVTSGSYSTNRYLVNETLKICNQAVFNDTKKKYTKDELISFLKDSDVAIVGLDVIDKIVIDSLPKLKMIAKYGVGLNNLDIEYLNKKGIKIGWTGGVNRLSVAEMTICFMLMLTRNIFQTSLNLKNGKWIKSGGSQLTGTKIGIIGLGNIGKEVVRLLTPFKCEILVNDISYDHKFIDEYRLAIASKEDIYKNCQVITIHTPLNETTQNMINRNVFENFFQSDSFLINTARGGIVSEEDLIEALKSNLIKGAAFDAFIEEPLQNTFLLNHPNFICTPHIGGNSEEAIKLMGESALKHIKDFINEHK